MTALQSLDLIGVDDITDNVLAAIGSGCALLQSLKLKLTNGRVSNAGLLSLMKHKSLRLLHLHGKDGIRWWNITPNGMYRCKCCIFLESCISMPLLYYPLLDGSLDNYDVAVPYLRVS